ncbi:hypothetical protein BB561_003596 [Smittium simulii]|uniref:Nas2 N-terminal domain-containing protein n=1 Tax=Smittium simulii TaxID=133385 RepID=A0A2T9YKH5_9FUNG|nr:hypothetical protein BB561_003596 [Smittium simulii]
MDTQDNRISSAKLLIQQKLKLEQGLLELETQLKENGAGLNTSLLDEEGFPRADIDIVTIRKIRVEIIEKQNDLKALVAKIEASLVDIHQNMPKAQDTSQEKLVPFCKIGVGLNPGDRIISFGHINQHNHSKLSMLAKLASENMNTPIKINVIRNSGESFENLQLNITPSKQWSGNGILGCSFLLL